MSAILKKVTATVVTMCMLFSIITCTFATPSDAECHWAASAIDKWINLKLIQGNEDGMFKPDTPITRAEFISFVNRVFKFIEKTSAPFPDVNKDAWYADEMAKAFSAGIVKGDDQGDMRPDALLTREEAAVILSRVFSLKSGEADTVSKFSDTHQISTWSRDALNAMVGLSYISGEEGYKLAPLDNITRAETVKMIDNVMGRLVNKTGTFTINTPGNLVVNTGNVLLKDTFIGGNLYLTQGIGDGNIVLDNVKVKGKTFVQGGGENSVIVSDSNLSGGMVVTKNDGRVRIVARGTTEIAAVQLNSGAKLEEDNIKGKGFINVEVSSRIIVGQEITLKGDFLNVLLNTANAKVKIIEGKVNKLEVAKGAENSDIRLNQNTVVSLASINAPANISGSSNIQTAEINSDNVKMDEKPGNVIVKTGISQPNVAVVPVPTPTPPVISVPYIPSVPSNPVPTQTPIPGVLQIDTIKVNGDILTIKYNEEIDRSSLPAPEDFIVKAKDYNDLIDLKVTNVQISGQSIILTLEKPLASNRLLQVSYVQGQNPVRDALTKSKVSKINNEGVKLRMDLSINTFGVDGLTPLEGVSIKIVDSYDKTVMATGITNENGLLGLSDFDIPYTVHDKYVNTKSTVDIEFSKTGYETRYLNKIYLVCGDDKALSRIIPTIADVTKAVNDTRNATLTGMRDVLESNANALDFDMRVGSDYYLINDKDAIAKSVYDKVSTLYDKASIQLAFVEAVQMEASSEPLIYKEVYIDDDKDSVVLFFNKRIRTNYLSNTQVKNSISLSRDGQTFSALGPDDALVSTSGALELKLGAPLSGNMNKFIINSNTVNDAYGNVQTSSSFTDVINTENSSMPNADNSGVISIKQGAVGSKTVTLKIRLKNAFGTLLSGADADYFTASINNGIPINLETQPFSNFINHGDGYYTVDFTGTEYDTAYQLRILYQSAVIEPNISIITPKETIPLAADPGSEKVTYKTFNVRLDGSKSTVPEGKAITYNWSFTNKPVGSTAALMNSTSVRPEFIPDIAGDYSVGLTVSDGVYSSPMKTINIKAKGFDDTTDNVDNSVISKRKVFLGTGYNMSALIPLTDGWVIVKDLNNKKVVFLNVLSGEIGKEYTFSDKPDHMELDFERNLLFVSMLAVNKIARVNLISGDISYINTDAPVIQMTLGEKGILFALTGSSYSSNKIQVIDTENARVASTALTGTDNYSLMVYDEQGNNLIIGKLDTSVNSLARLQFNETTFELKQVQYKSVADVYGRDLIISDDGRHVSYIYGGNGAVSTILDLDSSDINKIVGEWNTGAYYDAAAFTLDNKYIVVSNSRELKIFDVDNHNLVRTFNKILRSEIGKIRISRGGKIIYDFVTGSLYYYQSNIE